MTSSAGFSLGTSFAVGVLLGATLFRTQPEEKVTGAGRSLTLTNESGWARSKGKPEEGLLRDLAERDRKLEEARKQRQTRRQQSA